MPSGCTYFCVHCFIYTCVCVCVCVRAHTLESMKNAPNFSTVVQYNEYKPM